MGVQDTGCLSHVPAGYGLIREYNGRCSYYQDSRYVSPNFRQCGIRWESLLKSSAVTALVLPIGI